MAITVTDMHDRLAEADTAIANGDWDAAEVAVMRARGVLAGLPDGAHNGAQVTWASERIKEYAAAIREKRGAGSKSLQFTGVEFKGAGS